MTQTLKYINKQKTVKYKSLGIHLNIYYFNFKAIDSIPIKNKCLFFVNFYKLTKTSRMQKSTEART